MKTGARLIAAGLVAVFAGGRGATAEAELLLASPALRVELAAADGSLIVSDLRTGERWRQHLVETAAGCRQRRGAEAAPGGEGVVLECGMAGIAADGRAAVAPARIGLRLDAAGSGIEATVEFTTPEGWRQASYPYVFARDGDRVSNLFPHCEGLLVPVRKDDPDWLALPDGDLYGGVHAYCMCLGIVDEGTGAGLLTLLPDIEDTLLRWREIPIVGRTVVAPQLVCRANLGRFERPWRMTFSFHDAGGHVALARRYRRFFADLGLHKTLREKAAADPAVNDLAGTTFFWACGSRPEHAREIADLLVSLGVDRCQLAMCNIPPRKDDPDYMREMAAAIRHIRGLGYHVYRYDQYRDAFEPDPAKPHSHQINLEAWPEKLVRRPDGSLLAAFGPGSGVVCPKFFLPLARARLDREFSELDYSAWFIDCIGSCGFMEGECHDAGHRTDRYECRREREALLRELAARGKLAATECGVDYLLPLLHWAEGGTTLVRYVEMLPRGAAADNAGINEAPRADRPDLLRELEKLPPGAAAPATISIGTRHRVPFYSLCHHDEIVQTWRWEDGMNHPAVYWQLKNLWSVLHGGAPMYRIYGDTVRKHAAEIGRTQRYVNSWVRRVAFDEMTDHRFLTPDRLVQETEFAGSRGVVVNFGVTPATLADGQVVPPRDYVSFEKAAAGRRYEPAPCPNVFAEE
jgi:hypothetical protein